MAEKLITKSFERLLDKGKYRGFITYEELGKSLGKRNSTNENIERALIILVDEKVTFVEKKSDYQSSKKKETVTQNEDKTTDKDTPQPKEKSTTEREEKKAVKHLEVAEEAETVTEDQETTMLKPQEVKNEP